MKRRWIIPVILLLACGGALALLQWRGATGEITPRPLLYLLADAQRQVGRVPLGLTRVSVQEENQIGEELARSHGGFQAHPNQPDNQRIAAYLNTVGQRLAAGVKRKGIRYRFHFLDDASFVNAFAMPGGQIVFGRGLLKLLENEDELAAILGHEIAHVDERHCIERLQYELKSRKLGLRGLYRLGRPAVLIFQAGYTKEKELEADRAGIALAVAAGYSPAGAIRVMERFAALDPRMPRQPASPVEEIARLPLQTLSEYFRSHPPARERAALFEREIAARGWPRDKPQTPLPLRAVFLTEEAAAFAERGLLDRAISKYEEALRLEPDYFPAWFGLARAAGKAGKAARAAEAASEAIRRNPENSDAWVLLARALAAADPRGGPARLRELYETTKPKSKAVDQAAWPALVETLWRAGDAAATANAAAASLRRYPEPLATWRLFAQALALSAASPAQAAEEFRKLERELDSPDLRARADILKVEELGLALAGNPKQALEDYQKMFAAETPAALQAELRLRMAWWLYRTGRLEQAFRELDAARQRSPHDVRIPEQMAWVLTETGRQADALGLSQRSALASAADYALAALIRWRLDRREKAHDMFQRAAAADEAWLSARWVANNYPTSAAGAFARLQAAELARRQREAEAQARRAAKATARSGAR